MELIRISLFLASPGLLLSIAMTLFMGMLLIALHTTD